MQQSVALKGDQKTLCFMWPRARECDGDPTGQRPKKGSATNNKAQGQASTSGPPSKATAAQHKHRFAPAPPSRKNQTLGEQSPSSWAQSDARPKWHCQDCRKW